MVGIGQKKKHINSWPSTDVTSFLKHYFNLTFSNKMAGRDILRITVESQISGRARHVDEIFTNDPNSHEINVTFNGQTGQLTGNILPSPSPSHASTSSSSNYNSDEQCAQRPYYKKKKVSPEEAKQMSTSESSSEPPSPQEPAGLKPYVSSTSDIFFSSQEMDKYYKDKEAYDELYAILDDPKPKKHKKHKKQ